MKSIGIVAFALVARLSCAYPYATGPFSVSGVVGTQDSTRISPAAYVPTGGITTPGRLAGAVAVYAETVAGSSEQLAQRSPIASGGGFVAVGFARADLWGSCRFADTRLTVSPNPTLPTPSPHMGVLWRCGGGARFAADIAPDARLVFGGSLTADNTLVRRSITETIDQYGAGLVFRSGPPAARTVIQYSERQTIVHPNIVAHVGLQYQPRPWLRLDVAGAAGFAPAIPRQTTYSGTSTSTMARFVSSLPVYEMRFLAYGWVGAAFGPEFARFALQLRAGGGDAVGNVVVGVDAAMIFSLEYSRRASTPSPCRGSTCQSTR